jgi:nucleotide-binding universal stress UspA family protein
MEMTMYKHILIATDGSELAAKGTEQGLSLAEALGAKATVLTVAEQLPVDVIQAALGSGAEDPVGLYEQQIDKRLKGQVETIEQRALKHNVTAEFAHEIGGSPAEAIIRTAKQLGCDLIVMSSHGRRGAARLLHGSQTAEVVTHTTIPVLVVR